MPGRCLLLEIPPELRLNIYIYIDGISEFAPKHSVVHDKDGNFRLKPSPPAPAISAVCRTIRNECLPISITYPSYSLDILDHEMMVTRDQYTRQRRLEYEGLALVSDCAPIFATKEITISIQCNRPRGKATCSNILAAVLEIIYLIEKAKNLQRVCFRLPKSTCGEVFEQLCSMISLMRSEAEAVTVEEYAGRGVWRRMDSNEVQLYSNMGGTYDL
ncbi:hypothetical protein B0A48_02454 [Cryoendolithus antarcticus]|uniref:Uncharacterized protein n=1 Tax=Cryoendolithus antarcticus TaxID=1507870 RepID=A0A1V8TNP1_9PEZI|nr:hypothetical protein B0A48_02454 [Cryoendolithus antarcticus]